MKKSLLQESIALEEQVLVFKERGLAGKRPLEGLANGCPRGEFDQSVARTRAPILPPVEPCSTFLRLLIFFIVTT